MTDRPHRGMSRRTRDLILSAVARDLGLEAGDLLCRRKTAPWSIFGRQLCFYLAHRVYGYSPSAIARAFGRDRSTVHYGIWQVRRLRGTPAFERVIGRLLAMFRDGRPA